MKKPILFMLTCISLILLSTCKKVTNDLKNEIEITQSTINNAAKVAKEAPKTQDKMEKLKELPHLTKVQFESWLPKTLLDLPLSSSSINMLPGVGSCGSNYNIGNKRIRVMIIDGAGERGASAVGTYMFSSQMDYDEETSYGYIKSRFVDGMKLKETYSKGNDKYNISMFYAERFAVDVETQEVKHEDIDKIIKELKLQQLTNF
ncbi:hypothetical protein [Litoribaculum gwangyangense]